MSAPLYDWKAFASPDAVAQAHADAVADRLGEAIAARGRAVLAVSGGTTPMRFFRALSTAAIGWEKVVVTLIDERFVPPTHDRSNEKLARENLLTGPAASARFVPLYSQAESVEAAARQASEAVSSLLPIDVAVLGIGTDGHTASLFPDAANADFLLSTRAREPVLAVHAPSAGEPRLTLALPVISQSRHVFLHIEGDEKRGVFESAMAEEPPRVPIRAVLDAAVGEIAVYWAPKERT